MSLYSDLNTCHFSPFTFQLSYIYKLLFTCRAAHPNHLLRINTAHEVAIHFNSCIVWGIRFEPLDSTAMGADARCLLHGKWDKPHHQGARHSDVPGRCMSLQKDLHAARRLHAPSPWPRSCTKSELVTVHEERVLGHAWVRRALECRRSGRASLYSCS